MRYGIDCIVLLALSGAVRAQDPTSAATVAPSVRPTGVSATTSPGPGVSIGISTTGASLPGAGSTNITIPIVPGAVSVTIPAISTVSGVPPLGISGNSSTTTTNINILNPLNCEQSSLKCPAGFTMTFCTSCMAKCTRVVASLSLSSLIDHKRIVVAPDGTNCTTNFFALSRQGVCRRGNCVTNLFRRNMLKLCPFGFFSC